MSDHSTAQTDQGFCNCSEKMSDIPLRPLFLCLQFIFVSVFIMKYVSEVNLPVAEILLKKKFKTIQNMDFL